MMILLCCASCAGRSDGTITTAQQAARMDVQRGNQLYLQGDFEAAAKRYDQAHAKALSIDDRRGVADALNNLGVLYLEAKRFADAQQKFSDALRIAEDIGDKGLIVAALNNSGAVLIEQDELAAAMIPLQRAQNVARSASDRAGQAASLNLIGKVQRLQGNVVDAQRSIHSAIDMVRNTRRFRLTAACFFNLGELRMQQGRASDAVFAFEQALTFDKKMEDAPAIAQDLLALGRANAALQRDAAAKDAYQRAYAVGVQLGRRDVMIASVNGVLSLGDVVPAAQKAEYQRLQHELAEKSR